MAKDSSIVHECRVAWIQKNRLGLTFVERNRDPVTGSVVRYSILSFAAPRSLSVQQRLDPFFEFLERERSLEAHAVDEEGRCRGDLQFLHRILLIGVELVELRLILLAGLDVLDAHAVHFADIEQRVLGLRHQAVL